MLQSLFGFFHRPGAAIVDGQRALSAPAAGAPVVAAPPAPQPAPARAALPGATVDSAAAKFLIGFLAAICAITFPRLLARLAHSEDVAVVFFPTPYLVLAVIVSLLIGVVIVIFEYGVPTKPRETFMTALGIPAVIAGALGTASSLGNVGNIKHDNERLKQEVRQERGIGKVGSFSSMEPIELKPTPPPAAPARKSSFLPLPIGEAHAQSGKPAQQLRVDNEIRFGIQVQQPRYVVVLKQVPSREEALREAQALRQQVPSAQAVKADSGYFVVLGDGARTETDAVLAAARIQKAVGSDRLRPVLVEVK